MLCDTTNKQPCSNLLLCSEVATGFANATLAPNNKAQGLGTARGAGESSTDHKGERKSPFSPDQDHGSNFGRDPADVEAAKARFMAKAQPNGVEQDITM